MTMQDGRAHPILAQIPLTVSPHVSLPVAVTLPYTYKSVPTNLPPSSTGDDGTEEGAKPQYVVAQSGHASHPDEIIASCEQLQAHLATVQADAEAALGRWREEVRQRELAEKRRVAPGWLDREEKMIEPTRASGAPGAPATLNEGAQMDTDQNIQSVPATDTNRTDEGAAMDRAFGGLSIG